MKSNKTLTTLSIAIPAHNEEKNLPIILEQLRNQTANNYELEKVLILCDGCTDNTAKIAQRLNNKWKKLDIVDDGNQLGKAARVQQAIRQLESEIILLLDADIVLQSRTFLDEITSVFDDKKVGLAGAAVKVINAKNFIQKSLFAYEQFWQKVTAQIKNGNNVHNNMGCAFAIRKSCAKKIKYPSNIVADDHYTYFWIIKNGWKFTYVPKSEAGFMVPASLKEFLQQKARYSHSQSQIIDSFKDIQSSEYYIPLKVKLNAYIQTFKQYPIYLLSALILNGLAAFTSMTIHRNFDKPFWESISTTK